MAYIDFNKETIVVLTPFETAAYINNYLYMHREDTFGSCADDAIDYGVQRDIVTPLADDQFSSWNIELVGSVHRYGLDELTNGKGDFYFVVVNDDSHYPLAMFSQDWVIKRKYTIRYTALAF